MSDSLDIVEELAEEGVGSGVEREILDNTHEPFDPSSISINSKIVSLDAVLRRLKNGTIILSPDFQRNKVWDLERQSRLIESMMLRIPLPMFYVAEDRLGRWEVVDGLQRLTAIQDFILGPDGDGKGYSLKGLEFWGDMFDGKTFFNLEKMKGVGMTVNHIIESELSFTIIKPDTPEKVKRNIFKRINTGGMRLSEQEIRHALYQGESTKLLSRLVASEAYKKTIGSNIKDERMAGRELALRYISFKVFGVENYKGDMDDFLSRSMIVINGDAGNLKFGEDVVISEYTLESLERDFNKALLRSSQLFGEHVFRKSFDGERKTPINKSLFDVWMISLDLLSDIDFAKLKKKKKALITSYQRLTKDDDFVNSISRYSGSITGVKERHSKVNSLIEEML
ncbi:DUF262 domain-containing protein [Gallaecimonas pentaromativorans]|uniref:DUF262 domain-containing protein n=1 Tax=Gallaecimonas pentaromativorans TaxID=584787 RepID=UPI003A8CE195